MIIPQFDDCRQPHGSMHCAFLYKGKKLIATGRNQYDRTTARVDGIPVTNRSLHAETAALSRVSQWREDVNYTLVVVRYTRDGSLACSKPCNHCACVIKRLARKYRLICKYSVKSTILSHAS